MNQNNIFYGATLEEAVEAAALKLNTSKDMLDYEVIKTKSWKLFGRNSQNYCIKAYIKNNKGSIKSSKIDGEITKQTKSIKDAIENADGYFNIEYCEDGVYLTVYPPCGTGKPVQYNQICQHLIQKNIQDMDEEQVSWAVKDNSGQPIKIAEAQEEFYQDAIIEITVDSDGLKAFAVAKPPIGKGEKLSMESVEKALSNAGVVFGIDREAALRLVQSERYGEKVLLAKGLEPVDGEDGSIKYLFETQKNVAPQIKDDGKVDFFNLNLINNVVSGQDLAVKIPPTPGKPGCNVYGTDIKQKPGKDVAIIAGKNVELSEDLSKATALVNGQVVLVDKKIHVFPLYEVKGDIDTSTGNIEFLGNVIIKGNVREGFTVKAEGNVEVNGAVEGAKITAGGNIVINRGIKGRGKGSLHAHGDIFVKYIEHSNVVCDGNLTVAEAIMHSNISVKGKVEVGGRKGLIVGGIIRSGEDVIAKNIGSALATQTDIEVGVNPSVMQKFLETTNELEALKANLNKLNQGIELLTKLEKTGKLPLEKQILLDKLKPARESVLSNLAIVERQSQEYQTEIANIDKGKVIVSENIYPGVKVAIGPANIKIKDTITRVTLYKSDSEIKIGPY